MKEYGEPSRGWGAFIHKEDVVVDIYYPRCDGDRVRFVQVGLSDVRAADNIRVSYDFDRNGWKIEQAQIFEWSVDDPVCDPQWTEVAFIRAWASKIGADE